MKYYSVAIQVKTTMQYFPVVLFITLYKVVLTSEFVDEILWCNQSNESFSALLCYGLICFLVFYTTKFGVFLEFL